MIGDLSPDQKMLIGVIVVIGAILFPFCLYWYNKIKTMEE